MEIEQMEQFDISTAILCGGRSSRMGQNKAFLEYNNKRFVDRLKTELSGFGETVISAAGQGEYDYLGIPVFIDEHENIGPIEGIYQVLKNIKNDYAFICAVDMPFIKKELVMYMMNFIATDYNCYVIKDEDRVQPLCAIYSKKILPVIEKQIENGKYRLIDILNNTSTKYIELKYTCFDKNIVRNVNTPQEYKKLALPIVFCVSGIKNSGKTSLIVKLIKKFTVEDYRVGVVKHDGHDFTSDQEGTDTFKFSAAGAEVSSIFSDTKYCINGKGHADGEFMIGSLLDKNMDVIILESFKYSKYPKVEVVRGEVSSKGVCDMDTLICMASDVVLQGEVKCPVYDIDDVDGIYSCIGKYFGI
jgi:molybdopterin-guanine dinucleotide biosynthesis protein